MQELRKRRDLVSGQTLEPDVVAGDVLLKLQAALNQGDQALEYLVGQLRIGECNCCFYGLPHAKTWDSLLVLRTRLAQECFAWSNCHCKTS